MRAGSLLDSSVGAYRLVDFLGSGGMGEVYRAVHVTLGRVVALKVLTTVGTDAVSLERFRNEARVHARLQHPNIATLFDFLEENGRPCIVMEYVDGQTLDERVRRGGGLPAAQALRIFAAVVDAVAYLHRSGIIHRDIKSNNVKISSVGEVKLLDFGIAKASFSPALTMVGGVMGTTYYLAPEQLTHGTADTRSDVWALGVLLYEMVTGRLPFQGEGIGSLSERIIRAAFPSPSSLNPEVPPAVEAIISRCLRRRPADRYASAGPLLEDVRALLTAPDTARRSRSAERPGIGQPRPAWSQHLLRVGQAGSAWLQHLQRVGRAGATRLQRFHRRRPLFAAGAALAAAVVLLWAVARPTPARVPLPGVDTASQTSAPPSSTELGFPARPRLENIHITVRGGRALVYREGRFIDGTPFDLTAAVGDRVRLTLKRAGYQPLRVQFTVSESQRAYEFALKPLPSMTVPQDSPGEASLGLLLVLPFAGWFGRRRTAGRRKRSHTGIARTRVDESAGGVPVTATNALAVAEAAHVVDAAVLSDRGCIREGNEDTIRLVPPQSTTDLEQRGYLAIVADGMGGHLAGEVASRLAVDVVESCYSGDSGEPAASLARALRAANAAIHDAAEQDAALAGMGTTCTALAIRRGLAYCAHVGDSRLYLVRGGELLQMTEDHSAVMRLVRHGVITRDEARHHPERNVILQALGSQRDPDISVWPRPFAVRSGDRFILCSDGLHDVVPDSELLARASEANARRACRSLVSLARERGAPDNVSVGILVLGAGADAATSRTRSDASGEAGPYTGEETQA